MSNRVVISAVPTTDRAYTPNLGGHHFLAHSTLHGLLFCTDENQDDSFPDAVLPLPMRTRV